MSLGIVCQFSPDPPTTLAYPRTWIDLSNRVLRYNIERGKQRILDRFEAGTMDLSLLNLDRVLDPENTAGPYYGSLLPMRPIRFGFVVNGVTYWEYFGFVERWPQVWEGPTWSQVDMTCVDGFELLSNHYLTSSYASLAAVSGAAGITYRANVFGYVGNSVTVTQNGVSNTTIIVGVSGTDITVTYWTGIHTNADIAAAIAADADASLLVTVTAATGLAFPISTTALTGGTFVQEYSGQRIGEVLEFVEWPYGPNLAATKASVTLFYRPPHPTDIFVAQAVAAGTAGNLISVTMVSGGSLSVAVSGVAITITLAGGESSTDIAIAVAAYAPAAALITILYNPSNPLTTSPIAQRFLAGGTAPSAGLPIGTIQVQAQTISTENYATLVKTDPDGDGIIYQAVTPGAPGNFITVAQTNTGSLTVSVNGTAITVGINANVTLDSDVAAAIAADPLASNLVTVTLANEFSIAFPATALSGASNDESTTALDHIQACELTENGDVFIAKNGSVAFLDETTLATSLYTTPQMAFVDALGGPNNTTKFGYTALQGDFDKDLIFNDIRSTRLNGQLQIASDPTSDMNYFTRTMSIQPLSISDTESLALAAKLLAKFKDPYFRFEPMKLFPGENIAFWQALCALELVYAVSVERHPPGGGASYTKVGSIIGIQIQGDKKVSNSTWTLQVDPQP